MPPELLEANQSARKAKERTEAAWQEDYSRRTRVDEAIHVYQAASRNVAHGIPLTASELARLLADAVGVLQEVGAFAVWDRIDFEAFCARQSPLSGQIKEEATVMWNTAWYLVD
jgi:hypothetical protein